MVYGVSEFAKALSNRRKMLGLSQAHVGKNIGAEQSYIGRFESGRHDIRLSRFVELARSLGMEVVLIPKGDAARIWALLRTPSGMTESALYTADEDDSGEDAE